MEDVQEHILQPEQQVILERFIEACQQDERIIGAFLGGSYARGAADPYSDLDLYLITTDEAYDDFYAQRNTWIRKLGEPVFLEDFGSPHLVFYVFENGAEGEVGIGRASKYDHIHAGPYQTLLDKVGILAGASFPGSRPEAMEQMEKISGIIYGFWHELSHFTTALGRGQLWWAQGQLEVMRSACVSLARLRSNFYDTYAVKEPYFKFYNGDAVPVELFGRLQTTFGPLEINHLYQAGLVTVQVFRALAQSLAQAHGIAYPEAHERVMMKRLEALRI